MRKPPIDFQLEGVSHKVVIGALKNWLWILLGERAGDRTQDPVIKSHVLYRLSYALA
jgi:hypothetical protein